jgi:hypothetical protein
VNAVDPDEADYYALELTWRERPRFVLWRSSTVDMFQTDPETGRLRVWPDLNALREFASLQGVELRPDVVAVFSLDEAKRFSEKIAGIESESALNLWNFFNDIAANHPAAAFEELDASASELYGRLFSMTSAGRIAEVPPSPLTIADLDQLRAIIRAGLSVVQPLLD